MQESSYNPIMWLTPTASSTKKFKIASDFLLSHTFFISLDIKGFDNCDLTAGRWRLKRVRDSAAVRMDGFNQVHVEVLKLGVNGLIDCQIGVKYTHKNCPT